MGEGETKDVQAPTSSEETPEATKDVSVIPSPAEEKPDDSKDPAAVESRFLLSSPRDGRLLCVCVCVCVSSVIHSTEFLYEPSVNFNLPLFLFFSIGIR